MRVALLGPGSSIHIRRWANGLASRNIDVHLITAHPPEMLLDPRVQVHPLSVRTPWAYVLSHREVAKYLKKIQPHLLNVHYATGYGFLATNSHFHPTLLSVWGSDIYDFPGKSPLHSWLVSRNIRFAQAVASTSACMARRTLQVAKPIAIFVTPFGVDEALFEPEPRKNSDSTIVCGTVKTLSQKYGVDVLINAFALACRDVGSSMGLHLEITGNGPDRDALKELTRQLDLTHKVTFYPAVAHEKVPAMLQRLDIFSALSRDDSESFGVAAVEAAACGLPVIVSNADGLAEVTLDKKTGFVVPKNDPRAAADALLQLIRDPNLRKTMGDAGRIHVLDNYTWEKSLDTMISAYQAVTAASAFQVASPRA